MDLLKNKEHEICLMIVHETKLKSDELINDFLWKNNISQHKIWPLVSLGMEALILSKSDVKFTFTTETFHAIQQSHCQILNWKCVISLTFTSTYLNYQGPISNTLNLLRTQFEQCVCL